MPLSPGKYYWHLGKQADSEPWGKEREVVDEVGIKKGTGYP